MTRSVPLDEIVQAYAVTGSVWKAAKELGLCGQSVWERLKKIGYPLSRPAWTEEEEQELVRLYREGGCSLGEIGSRLNRTYASVACKLNELGVKGKARESTSKKLPRGKGYDKVSTKRHAKALLADPQQKITRYARQQGLNVDSLVHALQTHFPGQYAQYAERHHGDIPKKECPHCKEAFVPANGKQMFCSRKCGIRYNADQSYFGGRRSEAVGMAEGICQLCGKKGHPKMHAHHVIGKRNDPDNKIMVALCPGCHQLVGIAARNKDLVSNQQAWENFIQLAWFEANGHLCSEDQEGMTLTTYVELEVEEGNTL